MKKKMNKLTAIIECSENNYSAYVREVDGVVATGRSVDEIKCGLNESLEALKEACSEVGVPLPQEMEGDYELEFRMDVKSLLDLYTGIFTKSGLERLTGINQKQLWHYANGCSIPRRAQAEKIEKAIHRLGEELLAIHL